MPAFVTTRLEFEIEKAGGYYAYEAKLLQEEEQRRESYKREHGEYPPLKKRSELSRQAEAFFGIVCVSLFFGGLSAWASAFLIGKEVFFPTFLVFSISALVMQTSQPGSNFFGWVVGISLLGFLICFTIAFPFPALLLIGLVIFMFTED